MSESQLPTNTGNLDKKSSDTSDNVGNTPSHASNLNASLQDHPNQTDNEINKTEYLTDLHQTEYLLQARDTIVTKAGLDDGASASNTVDTGSPGDLDNNDKDGDKDPKKKKNRCATCRKKVGLTGFECRCGGLFCAVHRYSDKHDCSFNYREMGAQEIRRNNPVVVGEKIQKI